MTTAAEPGTNGHQNNGYAPASRVAGILPPLPPVSDGNTTPKPTDKGRADATMALSSVVGLPAA
jgi:hypothetical protein